MVRKALSHQSFRIIAAKFNIDEKRNWIYQSGFQDYSNFDLYVTSFYFTVTTVVTVGFGDITAHCSAEKIFCIFLMLCGVIAFSFGTGALSSIISNYDTNQAMISDKIATLNNIKSEFKLKPELYRSLVRTIRYSHSNSSRDYINFLEDLPYKMKMEVAMVIHRNLYQTIDFFKLKDKGFILWIGNVLRPLHLSADEYLYTEGDDISESKLF